MQVDKGAQKFLPVAALCERYKVSRSTIYKWMEQGRLARPISFTARCVRWTESDLQAFEQNAQDK